MAVLSKLANRSTVLPSGRNPAARLLIADDQPHILEALDLMLSREGFILVSARSPAMVRELVATERFDGVLIDLNYTRDTTSGTEGLDLIAAIRRHDANVPIIVMTAWANVSLAVEAMRRGASDFIEKPWDNTRVLTLIRTQIDLHTLACRTQRLEAENRILRMRSSPDGSSPDSAPDFIATAPAMQPVVELLSRIGPSDANVLITGEHGTGKEVIAQMLHRLSRRAQRLIVAVNTGALSDNLFESELFGHVKGAFTDARTDRIGRFELAHQSTLFLDEIANIPLAQQAKLLRVLETGELERVGSSTSRTVDVRLVSATNANIRQEADAGRFRPDLYFRLNTVEIHLPPLRERCEDIPLLAAHFLARYAVRYRRQLQGFEPTALQLLLTHSWPGNVRELDHALERAVLMSSNLLIAPADLGLPISRTALISGSSLAQSLDELSLEDVETILIRKALARARGNVSHAAEALGLSRGALYRRIEKYRL